MLTNCSHFSSQDSYCAKHAWTKIQLLSSYTCSVLIENWRCVWEGAWLLAALVKFMVAHALVPPLPVHPEKGFTLQSYLGLLTWLRKLLIKLLMKLVIPLKLSWVFSDAQKTPALGVHLYCVCFPQWEVGTRGYIYFPCPELKRLEVLTMCGRWVSIF